MARHACNSPERFESIASKLENQDHAAQLPPDTDPTVVAGRLFEHSMLRDRKKRP